MHFNHQPSAPAAIAAFDIGRISSFLPVAWLGSKMILNRVFCLMIGIASISEVSLQLSQCLILLHTLGYLYFPALWYTLLLLSILRLLLRNLFSGGLSFLSSLLLSIEGSFACSLPYLYHIYILEQAYIPNICYLCDDLQTCLLFCFQKEINAFFPSPWKASGEVLGLKAPPLRNLILCSSEILLSSKSGFLTQLHKVGYNNQIFHCSKNSSSIKISFAGIIMQ